LASTALIRWIAYPRLAIRHMTNDLTSGSFRDSSNYWGTTNLEARCSRSAAAT
jgi:hypothetical protein